MHANALNGGPSCPLFELLEPRLLLNGAPPAPLLVDLQPASDSGVHDDDDLTNIGTSVIDITAAQEGDTIRVYLGGVGRWRLHRQRLR